MRHGQLVDYGNVTDLASMCFAELDCAELQGLLGASSVLWLDTGECLIREGAHELPALYVVLDGTAKVYTRSAGGREQVLALVGCSEILTDPAIFDGGNCQVNVDALEPLVVLSIPAGFVREVMQRHPCFALALMRSLAEQQRRLLQLVRNLAFRRVLSRTAALLLDDDVIATVNQTQMAAIVGTRREVLNRSLQRLARLGLIDVHGSVIDVLDPEGLRVIAEAG
jgi:CRP-like cAMP-binding protein